VRHVALVESGSIVSGDGASILTLARKHMGEKYIFGARAPMGNARWRGPWDCAEFASWCVYQSTGVLFGVEPQNNPTLADAFTGYWASQSTNSEARVSIEDAARIPGALVLRIPSSSRTGHIAISDGKGGTVEAHSTNRGVIEHMIDGRRWDIGVLVPGVEYFLNEQPVEIQQPAMVFRVTQPLMRGETIKKIQRALKNAGYLPGSIDGIYGPQTVDAVQEFQIDNGLVADGEAGMDTLSLMGL
jgi:hypothetical protein